MNDQLIDSGARGIGQDVECPICGAEPFQPCSIPDPKDPMRGIELGEQVHAERIMNDEEDKKSNGSLIEIGIGDAIAVALLVIALIISNVWFVMDRKELAAEKEKCKMTYERECSLIAIPRLP